MKKSYVLGCLILLFGLLTCGCGKKAGNDATPTPMQQTFRPCGGSVIIAEYKGLPYAVETVNISDEDVEKQIAQFLKQIPNYVRDDSKTGKAVASGDIVNIDFVGYDNGVAFEGGASKGYDLGIGSGSFIEGFEDGVIGMKVGEKKTISATFPNPYQNNTALSGKTVSFEVTVNYYVKQLYEVTDEYVEKNSRQLKTKDEFYAFVRENLEKDAKTEVEEAAKLKLLNAVVSASEFKAIDEYDVNFYAAQLMAPYEGYAKQYQMDVESFLKQFTPYSSYDELLTESKARAKESVKQFMVLQQIADKENITVTEEEYVAYVQGIADRGQYGTVANVESYFGRDYLMYNKKMEKTLDYLVEVSAK